MHYLDLISMSLSNLWRRKLRTLLTILGVFIGTASVLLMMSIGFGQSKAFYDSVGKDDGLTSIEVMSGVDFGPEGEVWGDKDAPRLNDHAIEQLLALPDVKEVVPKLQVQAMATQGKYQSHFGIVGIPRQILNSMEIPFKEGGFVEDGFLPLYIGKDIGFNFYNPNSRGDDFSSWEEMQAAGPPVDLYNEDFYLVWDVDALWQSRDPESGVAKPKRYPTKAAGIMGYEDRTRWSSYDYETYVPLEDLKEQLGKVFKGKAWPGQPKRKNGRPTGELIYSQLTVKATAFDKTKEVFQAVKDLGYRANSAIEWIESMEEESRRSQLVLGAIGGVSLIVAAIGIANTMMMSIYERTKEIGVYKVLGCSLYNIRNMFLAEAGFIGLFGGITGVLFSLLASFLLNRYGGAIMGGGMMGMGMGDGPTTISYIPAWLIPAALVFACLIGMLSGLMPARRAMRLSALEALRNE